MLLYQQKREDSDEILKDFTMFATEITRKIIAMDREKLFDEYIEECKKRKEWCGQGNPNANILIIGKEPYNNYLITNQGEIQRKLQFQYNLCRNRNYGKGGRDNNSTWRNYQKLIEQIFPKKIFNPKVFSFEKCAFTTELNTVFRPKAVLDEETTKNINKRLAFFKDSSFINRFPVIVLACGNFISNDEESGFLINNTFDVRYDIEKDSTGKPKGEHKEKYKSGHWFYTHHSENGKKLVIHTRQLSNLRDYQLIDDMATVIKEHLDYIEKLGKFMTHRTYKIKDGMMYV